MSVTYSRIFVDEAAKFESPLREEWQDLAECASTSPDAFFPPAGDSYKFARSICRKCEVREQCLAYVMTHEGSVHSSLRHGMYGGLTPRERQTLYLEENGLTEEDLRAS